MSSEHKQLGDLIAARELRAVSGEYVRVPDAQLHGMFDVFSQARAHTGEYFEVTGERQHRHTLLLVAELGELAGAGRAQHATLGERGLHVRERRLQWLSRAGEHDQHDRLVGTEPGARARDELCARLLRAPARDRRDDVGLHGALAIVDS